MATALHCAEGVGSRRLACGKLDAMVITAMLIKHHLQLRIASFNIAATSGADGTISLEQIPETQRH